ncbi:MAG: HlyD family efflux transporter periplasmic adaptor subunit [Nevskiaceae bacterium]|nr:MAG: HlyD family efflux transporter periplasmic adaptor subunit [Nevskiaceae bacterium]
MTKLLSLCLLLSLAACGGAESPADAAPKAAGGHEAPAAEPVKGPHRGVMLKDGPFAIELAVYETNVPPEYRAWPTLDGKPLPLGEVTLTVEVTRLGNKVNTFQFKPEGDFLRGDGVLIEPHSFALKVTAIHAGKTHTWAYDSFEGRTTIAAKIAEEAGIKTELAGPGVLTETLTLYGQIAANPERQREVSARFPGLIRTVAAKLGDAVKAGETLATIESNDSLQTYSLKAPLAGVVTQRDANPGEESGDRVLFTVTDTSAVIAELSVFPKDRARVQPGAAVTLRLADGDATVIGKVARVDVKASSNQSVQARVVIEQHDGSFLPGSFVTGEVAVAERQVPLAVKTTGLQAFRDFTVVYAQVGEIYEVRMLELGTPQGDMVEVLGGLEPGTRYVSENSYLIKADIEKSGASHDH